jgi:hypothetical protein
MKTLEFAKAIVFMVSLLLTVIVIDDVIENIIKYCKYNDDYFIAKSSLGDVHIIPVGLSIFAILFWTGFYLLTLFV